MQKMGDYNVFAVIGESPIKMWTESDELLTPSEVLRRGEEYFLYSAQFPLTNRAKRSDLYRLFLLDKVNYSYTLTDTMVLWSREGGTY